LYKHSGRTGLSIPVILLVGIPVIVVLAAIYSYIVVYCPVVGYVNVLFLGGYVLGAGFVLATLAKLSKSRSPGTLALLGLFVGLAGFYASWVFFIHALFGRMDEAVDVSVLGIASSPSGVWDVAKGINENGWWGPSGIAQWALVGIEAVIMICGVALITWGSIDREVFCEECKTWCEPFETMHMKPTEEILSSDVNSLDHMNLLQLEETDNTEYPRIDAEVLQCTGCKLTQAIRLKRVSQVLNDGNLEEQVEDVPRIVMQKQKAWLDRYVLHLRIRVGPSEGDLLAAGRESSGRLRRRS